MSRPPKPLWRKILIKAAPLVLAAVVVPVVTGVVDTVDRHVHVSVHLR